MVMIWTTCKVCGFGIDDFIPPNPYMEHLCDWCANWAEAEVAHARVKQRRFEKRVVEMVLNRRRVMAERRDRAWWSWRDYYLTHAPGGPSPLIRWYMGEKGVLG